VDFSAGRGGALREVTRCWRHEVGPDWSDSVAPILGLLNLPDTVWRIAAKASTESVEHCRDSVSGIPFAKISLSDVGGRAGS
jgi:hypothetical protein